MEKLEPSWFEKLASTGALPTDSDEERLRRTILMILALIGSAVVPLWSLAYWSLGQTVPGLITLGFTLVSLAGVLYFLPARRDRGFRFLILALILLLPPGVHWSMGGFAASSAVIIWAFFSPLCAVMLYGPRKAVSWAIALLIVLVVSGLLEPTLQANAAEIEATAIRAFFVLNLGTVFSLFYLTMVYFVQAREAAHQRSEQLLLNILPRPVAEQLKRQPGTIAQAFDEASILFADLVGFTPLSTQMAPDKMVELLNDVFSYYDSLVEKYGLEKIRTIGDNYMVVSGVPRPRLDHAEAIAHLALEMTAYPGRQGLPESRELRFRIGINSGAVVAGVIGHKKFQYDVWGDAVNIASRMESQGVPGKIQITRQTFESLKNGFVCQPRGVIDVKGKGKMETWFLEQTA